ncbi:MAG: tRNA (N6-threonylcarbamoyladenosine(37)-N6)-methyltransferase TrmO [Coriobacteriia bacterium]
MALTLEPIGIIHTPYLSKEDAPIQGAFRPESAGVVEIHPKFAEGLDDIEGFSHLILLYELDRSAPVQLRRQPLLCDEVKGVFATRHPARPSRIGLTVVKLISREENRLHVGMVDMLDGTPLIDIKPYVARFDSFPDASEGWFAACEDRAKPLGRE